MAFCQNLECDAMNYSYDVGCANHITAANNNNNNNNNNKDSSNDQHHHHDDEFSGDWMLVFWKLPLLALAFLVKKQQQQSGFIRSTCNSSSVSLPIKETRNHGRKWSPSLPTINEEEEEKEEDGEKEHEEQQQQQQQHKENNQQQAPKSVFWQQTVPLLYSRVLFLSSKPKRKRSIQDAFFSLWSLVLPMGGLWLCLDE